jgi:hypothetical protein
VWVRLQGPRDRSQRPCSRTPPHSSGSGSGEGPRIAWMSDSCPKRRRLTAVKLWCPWGHNSAADETPMRDEITQGRRRTSYG